MIGDFSPLDNTAEVKPFTPVDDTINPGVHKQLPETGTPTSSSTTTEKKAPAWATGLLRAAKVTGKALLATTLMAVACTALLPFTLGGLFLHHRGQQQQSSIVDKPGINQRKINELLEDIEQLQKPSNIVEEDVSDLADKIMKKRDELHTLENEKAQLENISKSGKMDTSTGAILAFPFIQARKMFDSIR